MPSRRRLENQETTPVLFSCSAIITKAPNQIKVSQALFSDKTSSQSIAPVMIRTKRPTNATTVGSSMKAGPRIMDGTLAQSINSKKKVPIMTFSPPASFPMRSSSDFA
ncbi:hypothetical protein D3C72_1820760 [compost metagenome]